MADERSLIGRLLKAFAGVLEKYAKEARDEAKGEVRRVIVGFMAMVLTGVFMLHAAAFAHAFAVATAVHFGAPLYLVLAAVLGFDLCMALFGLLVARIALWRPILPRTRRNVAEITRVYHLIAG